MSLEKEKEMKKQRKGMTVKKIFVPVSLSGV
jgi:hypothetical protein